MERVKPLPLFVRVDGKVDKPGPWPTPRGMPLGRILALFRTDGFPDLLASVEPDRAAVDRARGVHDVGRYQSGVGGPASEARCPRERVCRAWPSAAARPDRAPRAGRPRSALQVPNSPGRQLPFRDRMIDDLPTRYEPTRQRGPASQCHE
jgi:hypothetical protein